MYECTFKSTNSESYIDNCNIPDSPTYVLRPDPGANGAKFGAHGIAVDGDYIVVGSPEERGRAGRAYVFRKRGSTWNRTKLSPPSGEAPGTRFLGENLK